MRLDKTCERMRLEPAKYRKQGQGWNLSNLAVDFRQSAPLQLMLAICVDRCGAVAQALHLCVWHALLVANANENGYH
jgi:hypothetical protein